MAQLVVTEEVSFLPNHVKFGCRGTELALSYLAILFS